MEPSAYPLLATGWGATEAGPPPIDLQEVQVPLVSEANCNDANSYNGDVTDTMLCAGIDEGGKDTCQGDSGGPLTRGPGNTVLTGITSWGIGCADANFFGVYTRVSNPAIRGFVETALTEPGADAKCKRLLAVLYLWWQLADFRRSNWPRHRQRARGAERARHRARVGHAANLWPRPVTRHLSFVVDRERVGKDHRAGARRSEPGCGGEGPQEQ